MKALREETGNNGNDSAILDKDSSAIVGGGEQDQFGEDAATSDQLVTPWTRFVARYNEQPPPPDVCVLLLLFCDFCCCLVLMLGTALGITSRTSTSVPWLTWSSKEITFNWQMECIRSMLSSYLDFQFRLDVSRFVINIVK